MRIVFDPDFDAGCWPGPRRGARASAGEDWAGPSRFVQVLETALGLGGPYPSARERGARLVPAMRSTEGFWSRSAAVDPFATARRLLHWRDTLAMGGWRGKSKEPRLAALGALAAHAAPGLPDRLHSIAAALVRRSPGIDIVELFVPLSDLDLLWRRTLELLEQRGTRIVHAALQPAIAGPGTDLANARADRFVPRGDGTLCLLRPHGLLAAAEEVAAWLSSLGAPGAVIIGGDPALDAALHRHGLPTTGAAHEVRDAAPLQILPLVLELAWTPQDPQRAYELLSLRSTPVPGEVASLLRGALSRWPAVDSDAWRSALQQGLAAIEDVTRRERVKHRLDVLWEAGAARDSRYPVAQVARRTEMVRRWLLGRGATDETNASAWRAAVAQCDSLLALVQHSGLDALNAALLRHLVAEATASASPASVFPPQAGLSRVGTAGGVGGPARVVAWWGFDAASARTIERLPLTRAERDDLHAQGADPRDPAQDAAAQARRWRRPLEQACEGLLLVCPEKDAAGEELHPHPLWDELVARVRADKNTRRVAERAMLRAALTGRIGQRRREALALPAPRREWTLPQGAIERREQESPSSVERLLQCPFQWALQYAARLYPPDSAQVEEGTSPRLLGELLHGIMNQLFAGPARPAGEAAREAGEIFDREGPRLAAALFLPGADANRELVRRAAVQTAATLYRLMAEGRLTVTATEQERVGDAFDTKFAGRVDLVLGHPPRILDLKWSGANRKRLALKEGTAVQLAAYSFLERAPGAAFPPVAYFVMDTQRLLTTEPSAFPGAEQVDGPSPESTWKVLQDTHDERWRALAEGRVLAPGAEEAPGEPQPKIACVKDGRLVLPGQCQWCDFTALCGLAFVEDL